METGCLEGVVLKFQKKSRQLRLPKIQTWLIRYVRQVGAVRRQLIDETNVESNTTIPSLGHMELKPNKLKSTWTRLNRMNVGPLTSADIMLQSTTSKRGLEDVMNPDCIIETEATYHKLSKGNREDVRADNTSAGVDDHPCLEQ